MKQSHTITQYLMISDEHPLHIPPASTSQAAFLGRSSEIRVVHAHVCVFLRTSCRVWAGDTLGIFGILWVF